MIAIVRVVLVLLLGLAATTLLIQNSTPVLAITVLGVQLPALSLGLLILLTCSLGVLTGIGFNLLFNQLQSTPVRSRQGTRVRKNAGNPFARKKSQTSSRSIFGFKFGARSKAKTDRSQFRQPQEGYSDWYTPPQTDWVSVSGSEYDSRAAEEWNYDKRSDSRSACPDFSQRSSQPDDELYYETERRSGKSQSVVDAEYRVLNSPNPESTSQQRQQRVDEWDDEFFDED